MENNQRYLNLSNIEDYDNLLSLIKKCKSRIIYLYGLPASGKTRTAALFSLNEGIVNIDPDKTRQSLGGFSNEREFLVFKKVCEQIGYILKNTQDKIIISECLYSELLQLIEFKLGIDVNRILFIKIFNMYNHVVNNQRVVKMVPFESMQNLLKQQEYCEYRYVPQYLIVMNNYKGTTEKRGDNQ